MRRLLLAATLVVAALAHGQETGPAAEIQDALDARMAQQSDKWFEDGHFPVILQMLKVQQEWYPLEEEVATDLSWMYKNIERPDLELITVSRYAKRNATEKDHLYPLANFYFLAKSYVNVISILAGIEKQVPAPHPNAFRILAHSYSKVGLHKDSLRIWDAYIKMAPDDLQAKNNRQKVADVISGKSKPTETPLPNTGPKRGKPPVKPPKGG
ncbi:MAG: hypothetical protein JSS65_08470, partial [Armatimonadetes bacterium]|nr:hypothetical protein [Armatimonadota bacterium]